MQARRAIVKGTGDAGGELHNLQGFPERGEALRESISSACLERCEAGVHPSVGDCANPSVGIAACLDENVRLVGRERGRRRACYFLYSGQPYVGVSACRPSELISRVRTLLFCAGNVTSWGVS